RRTFAGGGSIRRCRVRAVGQDHRGFPAWRRLAAGGGARSFEAAAGFRVHQIEEEADAHILIELVALPLTQPPFLILYSQLVHAFAIFLLEIQTEEAARRGRRDVWLVRPNYPLQDAAFAIGWFGYTLHRALRSHDRKKRRVAKEAQRLTTAGS